MKKFANLITLLPCHSLEDFPVHASRDDSRSLLAAWTALWHPELIATAEKAPIWRKAFDTVSSDAEAEEHREQYIHQHYYDDDSGATYDDAGDLDFDHEAFSERWQESLVVIPRPSLSQICSGFPRAAAAAGAVLFTEFDSRNNLIADIGVKSAIDPSVIADFYSLGYVRLQVEMMTQKLRYSSNLDLERFEEAVVAAAVAAKNQDTSTAVDKLQSVFDQLAEEKSQYYPTAADFVDVVLVSESIRAESVEAELETYAAKSLVVTGQAIRKLSKSPSTVEKLRDRIGKEELCVIAGPEHELPDNLLSIETIQNQIRQGLETCEEILGCRPTIFMRRRFGLNSSLPGILESLGFVGAIHATLDQGAIPKSYSNSVRWMGVDGGALLAVGQTPLDASSDKSFLDLGVRIGTELDSAHVSTIFFARWPTQTCDSFEDLRRSLKYGDVLGGFSNADSYFDEVYDPGYGDAYEADEYAGPWLEQSLKSGSNRPVSTFVEYWQNWYSLSAVRSLVSIMAMRDQQLDPSIWSQLDALQLRIEVQTVDWNASVDSSVSNELTELHDALLEQAGCFSVNTVPWKRRLFLSFDAEQNSLLAEPVKFVDTREGRTDAVVEMSGFGQLFARENAGLGSAKEGEPNVDDGESILRNEFFEVRMDRQSGGIKGVHFYGKRGNLLSQRLAVRTVCPESKEVSYSRMVCDSFEVKTLSKIASEITTSGSLKDGQGNCLANFKQTVGLQRGRELINIDIKLSDVVELDGSAGNYVANRIAWSDETADLNCDIQTARHPVRNPFVEAPHYVEVSSAENRFAILTRGLPWHRRASKKMLDSILVVGAETRRSFSLGVAINQESPMQVAIAEMHPTRVTNESDTVDEGSQWLFHIANRNLVSTGVFPIINKDCRCAGLRVRLRETDGSSGVLKLYCKRRVLAVVQESLAGICIRELPLSDSAGKGQHSVIEFEFSAFEYFQLKIEWAEQN